MKPSSPMKRQSEGHLIQNFREKKRRKKLGSNDRILKEQKTEAIQQNLIEVHNSCFFFVLRKEIGGSSV